MTRSYTRIQTRSIINRLLDKHRYADAVFLITDLLATIGTKSNVPQKVTDGEVIELMDSMIGV